MYKHKFYHDFKFYLFGDWQQKRSTCSNRRFVLLTNALFSNSWLFGELNQTEVNLELSELNGFCLLAIFVTASKRFCLLYFGLPCTLNVCQGRSHSPKSAIALWVFKLSFIHKIIETNQLTTWFKVYLKSSLRIN